MCRRAVIEKVALLPFFQKRRTLNMMLKFHRANWEWHYYPSISDVQIHRILGTRGSIMQIWFVEIAKYVTRLLEHWPFEDNLYQWCGSIQTKEVSFMKFIFKLAWISESLFCRIWSQKYAPYGDYFTIMWILKILRFGSQ